MAGKAQKLEWHSKAYEQTSKNTYERSGKEEVERVGLLVQIERYQPSKVTTVQGNQPEVRESTNRIRHEDKQSGSYERCTMKEKVSSGDIYVEKQTGRVGIMDEHTRKSTLKIGDKSGYTEYFKEQRVRQVDFGNEYSSKNTIDDYQSDDESGSNNTIEYASVHCYHGNDYYQCDDSDDEY